LSIFSDVYGGVEGDLAVRKKGTKSIQNPLKTSRRPV
jgi:hypothetical protein